MSMEFENMVRCLNCKKEFHENEVIYDGDEDMEFCPYCGEGNCIKDLQKTETESKDMTTDMERKQSANNWNDMQVGFLIDYMEKVKSSLEVFESLGREASDMIDNQITELESLRADYEQED